MKKETARQRFKKWLATKQWVISTGFENALADFFGEENTEADAAGYARGVKITKDQMRAKMPCGHPVACIEGAPDFAGDKHATTQYCAWCADIADTHKSAAEAMREQAALRFHDSDKNPGLPPALLFRIQREIRDLPLPKPKP